MTLARLCRSISSPLVYPNSWLVSKTSSCSYS